MTASQFTTKQILFKELFVGTLIYSVVLGFFDDYWHLVDARSFSTIFMAAFVLEVLTYLILLLKKQIVIWLKDKEGAGYKFAMFFMVWLVMFLSKFVFLWAIDGVFGDAMTIYGFVAIFVLALTVTALHKLADYVFKSLGNTQSLTNE